jgi:membrane associated rhomboid family serine protease
LRPPEDFRRAPATLAFAGAATAAWVLASLFGLNDWAAMGGGFIPARVSGALLSGPALPVWLTPLSATLVHSGIAHLLFNMLILVFCGRSVEGILGTGALVALYVLGAFAAAAAHYAMGPGDLGPMVGASGAISAVLGAYAILFGRNRVKVGNPTLALWLNALWLAGGWIILQLLIGFTFVTPGARVAIGAHIGGFLVGLALARPLLMYRYRKA